MSSIASKLRTRDQGQATALADEVAQKFRATKRLPLSDQRMAAINLGKLAVKVCPEKPVEGVRRIIEKSGLRGVLEKRTRFFCLPDEVESKKDGTYNANPEKFLTLAKEAAHLLCNSNDPELLRREEARAVRFLLSNTSYLPTRTPDTVSERSVKGLMEEYGVRLSEAIEQRTRIVELWQALDTTPITVKASEEEEQQSVYGLDAVFPHELLKPLYKPFIKSGIFAPDQFAYVGSWAEPFVELGCIIVSYEIFALKIPDDKAHLFPSFGVEPWGEDDPNTNERNEWLEGIEFDVVKHRFNDGEIGPEQEQLKRVTVAFTHNVSLGIRRAVGSKVEIQLSIYNSSKQDWGYPDFYVSTLTGNSRIMSYDSLLMNSFSKYIADTSFEFPVRAFTLGPVFNEDNEDDYSFDDYCEDYGGNCFLAEVPKNRFSDEISKILLLGGGLMDGHWANEEESSEYDEIKSFRGWIDDPLGPNILLGANNLMFIPTIKDAEPKAGAARVGSLAASLLENASCASASDKISQLLIDRVALTADSGLRFYEAMIENSRAAINKI